MKTSHLHTISHRKKAHNLFSIPLNLYNLRPTSRFSSLERVPFLLHHTLSIQNQTVADIQFFLPTCDYKIKDHKRDFHFFFPNMRLLDSISVEGSLFSFSFVCDFFSVLFTCSSSYNIDDQGYYFVFYSTSQWVFPYSLISYQNLYPFSTTQHRTTDTNTTPKYTHKEQKEEYIRSRRDKEI